MKQRIFKFLLVMLALQVGVVFLSSAQKREQTERIIIQKKGNKPEKMIIEIDCDKKTLSRPPNFYRK